MERNKIKQGKIVDGMTDVKLSLGVYDPCWDLMGSISGQFKRGNRRCFKFRKRSSHVKHNHAGNHVLLDRNYGNWAKVRPY